MAKIRIRHGEDEIELEGEDNFLEKQLKDFYERIEKKLPDKKRHTLKNDLIKPPPKRPTGKEPTPAEFYRSKKRTDGISKLLIFAKYLEEYRDISEFTPRDINNLAKDVKLPKDIHAQYFSNAVKQGLLRSHGSSKYSLTLSAEEALASMI